MALDGAFVHKTLGELKTAIDCHIDKIYQPSRDELVFLLRKKGFQKRLFISAKSGAQRVHFTENKYENPATPPMFCMLMRKYLLSARLIDISQPKLERVITFIFSATSEMGDITEIRLVCELIGGKANIILVNGDGKIIDALRRSDVESSSRLILPGATYKLPEREEKLNPINSNTDEILKEAQKTSFLKAIDGFSPLICREIENSQQFKSIQRLQKDAAKLKDNISLKNIDKVAHSLAKVDIAAIDKELEERIEENVLRDKELAKRDEELAQKDRELAQRDKELEERIEENARKDKELQEIIRQHAETDKKHDEHIAILEEKLDSLNTELIKIQAEKIEKKIAIGMIIGVGIINIILAFLI